MREQDQYIEFYKQNMEKQNFYSLLQIKKKTWLASLTSYACYLSSYVICSNMM